MAIFFWGAIFSSGIIFSLAIGHLIRLWLTKPYVLANQIAVAVIVPCKGDGDPDFKNNLLSIIHQDYTGPLQVVFSAESEADPAVPVLRQFEQQYPQVQVCIAGLATRCAQKTFNILKGINLIADTDIFLIADADIQPHTTWLQEMVAPFSDPRIGVVTGFFRRVPISARFRWGEYLAGFFGACIGVGMSDDRIKGVWGGSLALRKSIMDRYHLHERLATEIVDDMAIMHALHRYRLERRYVPSCTLKSYCNMSTVESIEWLIRQLQFSQIYFKELYFFYYLMIIPYALSILAIPVIFVYGLVRGEWLASLVSIGLWASIMLVGLLLWLGIPVNPANVSPGDKQYRLIPWMLITPVAFIYGAVALLKTCFRVRNGLLIMHWRNIEYRVNPKTGKVVEVIRPPASIPHQPTTAAADRHETFTAD